MKQKYIYAFLFALPGFVIAAIGTVLAGGMLVGFFWLFVFGDSSWPAWTQWILVAVLGLIFIIILFFTIWLGFSFGKNRELENKPFNSFHILISILSTAILVILIIFYQWSGTTKSNKITKVENFISSLNQVSQINITKNNESGFELALDTSGGQPGKYNLSITIYTDLPKKIYYKSTESLTLEQSPASIIRTVSFDDLFKSCQTALAKDPYAYVCINNAGTDSIFQIDAALTYLPNPDEKVTITSEQLNVNRSAASIEFRATTSTHNNKVKITDFIKKPASN